MKQVNLQRVKQSLRSRWVEKQNYRPINQIARQVRLHSPERSTNKPVLVFNASARLMGFSQNAAFSLISSWSLRLSGAPLIHFACQAGMSHCVQGTNREDYTKPPPCDACISLSRRLYQGAQVEWFTFEADPHLAAAIENLNIDHLCHFEYPVQIASLNSDPNRSARQVMPLGQLVLPSLRWALRCHDLPDDPPTCYLMRQYLLSAYQIARQFSRLIDRTQPGVALIFNGIMYPEAAARWVAQQSGVRVVTHEVGFQPFSAFFTDGQATAYPIHIPDNFELNPDQQARLDAYLENRFQGKFSMAGIRFWPEINRLDEAFLEHATQFRQIVPVFTNVIYDTSQVHANTIFAHMFAWLDATQEIIKAHPETLFVIRAHPDEMRPGSKKQSRQSVRDWVVHKQVDQLPNVIFIDSQDYISSYELIQRAKFLMVYNSSIGLEASLLGVPVLCAAQARYTQYPTVFSPDSADEFQRMAHQFLVNEPIQVPQQFQNNARRFLHYQLYRASLPFDLFLQNAPRPGFVQLRPFSWQSLMPQNNPTLTCITNGILNGTPFLLDQ